MIHVALLFVLYSWIPLTPHPPKKNYRRIYDNQITRKQFIKQACIEKCFQRKLEEYLIYNSKFLFLNQKVTSPFC